MTTLRDAAASLLARGVISAGWYSILTGLAMVYLAVLLGSVGGDPAAPYVAVVLAAVGLWQLGRGVREERGGRSAR